MAWFLPHRPSHLRISGSPSPLRLESFGRPAFHFDATGRESSSKSVEDQSCQGSLDVKASSRTWICMAVWFDRGSRVGPFIKNPEFLQMLSDHVDSISLALSFAFAALA